MNDEPMCADTLVSEEACSDSAPNPVPKIARRRAAFVYFIRCETARAMKIGVAVNPFDRLAELQVGCPHELKLYAAAWEPDARAVEVELHARFASHRLRGEWFECTDEMRFLAQDRAAAAREGGITWRNMRWSRP